jgi:hypothetical protein
MIGQGLPGLVKIYCPGARQNCQVKQYKECAMTLPGKTIILRKRLDWVMKITLGGDSIAIFFGQSSPGIPNNKYTQSGNPARDAGIAVATGRNYESEKFYDFQIR